MTSFRTQDLRCLTEAVGESAVMVQVSIPYLSVARLKNSCFLTNTLARCHYWHYAQDTKKAEEAKKAEEIKAAELEEAGDVGADDTVSNATAVRDLFIK